MNKNIKEYINDLKRHFKTGHFDDNEDITAGFAKDYLNLNDKEIYDELNSELNKLGYEIKSVKEREITFLVQIIKIK